MSKSVEYLDATIIKVENCRTQFRSKHQKLRIALGNKYEERFQANLETKLVVIKEMLSSKSAKARSMDFSLRSINNQFQSVTIVVKSFKDVSDGEVTRRKNYQSNQIKLFKDLSKKTKDVLQSLSKYPGTEREVERIMRSFEELT